MSVRIYVHPEARTETVVPAAGVVLPERPHMPDAEAACLARHLAAASCFLEYGCGGSTRLAERSGVSSCISVDTDGQWIAAVAASLAQTTKTIALVYCHVGPVGAWGMPSDLACVAAFPRYAELPWLTAAKLGVRPDLILVDGRFRVASFLHSMLAAEPGTPLLFDDYANRPEYHVVEEFVKPAALVGRMGVFACTRPARSARLEEKLAAYALDPA